jgi:Na+:H+ antiporter, NhaA family
MPDTTARVSAPSPITGPRRIRPLVDFLHAEASAGILLVGAAVVALVWANSPWWSSYFDLWGTDVTIVVGSHELSLTVRDWINDLAMVLFFFVAGLEIKREVTQGELRDPRQAALPVIAALGGMVVPALFFVAFNAGGSGARGWGIPMATDIAIVTGVVALLGSRAPSWLKLFLLALAIADDIGAIVVIAIFYSEGVSLPWLATAVLTLVVAYLIRPRIPYVGVYLALGALCWWSLHEANIHTTLTGVAFGLLAPVTPRRDNTLVDATEVDELIGLDDVETASRLARHAQESVSVVEWLEFRLHPWSAFVVVPLFALANAGIRVPTGEIGHIMSQPVTWGVMLGLVLGKPIGITIATMLAVWLRIGRLPETVTWRYVVGAGALAGIGFTVSLFVTDLAFGESIHADEAKLGVLVASLAAALIGCAICVPGRVEDTADAPLTRRSQDASS